MRTIAAVSLGAAVLITIIVAALISVFFVGLGVAMLDSAGFVFVIIGVVIPTAMISFSIWCMKLVMERI